MKFDLSQLDRWVESDEFEATGAGMSAYALATNDANPRHLGGDLAPPLFAVRQPVSRTMKRANDLVTSAFCLHGEHDIRFHRPIVPGMQLRARAAVIGVHQRSTGVALTIFCETRALDGGLVNEQYQTNFAHRATLAGAARGAMQSAKGYGHAASDHRMPPGATSGRPLARIVHNLTADQTRRYGAASGDLSDYTFDDAAARAKGLPGAILHGLLTMALCGRAIVDTVCEGDSTRLRRLAVRFSGLVPMTPGQQVITEIWPVGGHDRFGFEANCGAGTAAIRNGLAEISQ